MEKEAARTTAVARSRPGRCHCDRAEATIAAIVAGVAIDLCPACVEHYRAQVLPDGSPVLTEPGEERSEP